MRQRALALGLSLQLHFLAKQQPQLVLEPDQSSRCEASNLGRRLLSLHNRRGVALLGGRRDGGRCCAREAGVGKPHNIGGA